MENSRVKTLLKRGELGKVAKKAKVSKTTASECINYPEACYSDEVKMRVLNAAEWVISKRKSTSDVLKNKRQQLLKDASAA